LIGSSKHGATAPAKLEASRIFLATEPTYSRRWHAPGALVLFDDDTSPHGVGGFQEPYLWIGVGERQLPDAALGVLIEDARFDAGVLQPMQDEVGLL